MQLSVCLCMALWTLGTMAYHPFEFKSNETGKYVSTDAEGNMEYLANKPISGCGPLPRTGGLSWDTRSGRPVKENSTVYEEYFPRCPQGGALNSDIKSIRCWETLMWDVPPGNLACTDPPFPKIYIIAICAAVAGLALFGGSICIAVFVCRKRRTPHHSVSDTDQPLAESTYTATKSGAQDKFIAMTVVKQEDSSMIDC